MEAEATDPQADAPPLGDGIGRRRGRHRRVERGVEARHHRRADGLQQGAQRAGGRWIVQRRQARERVDSRDRGVVGDHRRGEVGATVDDPHAAGVERRSGVEKALQRAVARLLRRRLHLVGGDGGVAGVDDAQLERARPGVDDEDGARHRTRR